MKKFVRFFGPVFLFLVSFTLISPSWAAHSFQLNQGDYRMTPLSGRVYSVNSLCPSGAHCLLEGTLLNVEFTLQGCGDGLGPVFYKVVPRADQTVDVYISALNIHNTVSEEVFCLIPPTHILGIQLINQFYRKGMIRVHSLQSH